MKEWEQIRYAYTFSEIVVVILLYCCSCRREKHQWKWGERKTSTPNVKTQFVPFKQQWFFFHVFFYFCFSKWWIFALFQWNEVLLSAFSHFQMYFQYNCRSNTKAIKDHLAWPDTKSKKQQQRKMKTMIHKIHASGIEMTFWYINHNALHIMYRYFSTRHSMKTLPLKWC